MGDGPSRGEVGGECVDGAVIVSNHARHEESGVASLVGDADSEDVGRWQEVGVPSLCCFPVDGVPWGGADVSAVDVELVFVSAVI